MKHLILDCSETLLDFGGISYLTGLLGDREHARRVHYTLFRSFGWHEYDCGRLRREDLDTQLLPLLDAADREVGAHYLRAWSEQYTVIPGIPELLAQWKEQGYSLYVLSDFPPCFEDLWEKFEIFRLFDGRIVSYEEGLRKSDGGLFERALEKFGLQAEDCFFADDVPANVAAAEQCGIRGHVFTTVEALREAVASLG